MLNPPAEEDEAGMFEGVEIGDGFYGNVGDTFVNSTDEEGQESEVTSEHTREAMLAHLDSILQVPPHLEVEQGPDPAQFDDGPAE